MRLLDSALNGVPLFGSRSEIDRRRDIYVRIRRMHFHAMTFCH